MDAEGAIVLGEVSSIGQDTAYGFATGGIGGNVTIVSANAGFTVGNVTADGGNAADVCVGGAGGSGGTVTLTGDGDSVVAAITATGGDAIVGPGPFAAFNGGIGGMVAVESGSGNLTLTSIDTSGGDGADSIGDGAVGGNAGSVTLDSNNAAVGGDGVAGGFAPDDGDGATVTINENLTLNTNVTILTSDGSGVGNGVPGDITFTGNAAINGSTVDGQTLTLDTRGTGATNDADDGTVTLQGVGQGTALLSLIVDGGDVVLNGNITTSGGNVTIRENDTDTNALDINNNITVLTAVGDVNITSVTGDINIGTGANATVTAINGDISITNTGADISIGSGGNDGFVTTAAGDGDIDFTMTGGTFTLGGTNSRITSGGTINIDPPANVIIGAAGMSGVGNITIEANDFVTINALTESTGGNVSIRSDFDNAADTTDDLTGNAQIRGATVTLDAGTVGTIIIDTDPNNDLGGITLIRAVNAADALDLGTNVTANGDIDGSALAGNIILTGNSTVQATGNNRTIDFSNVNTDIQGAFDLTIETTGTAGNVDLNTVGAGAAADPTLLDVNTNTADLNGNITTNGDILFDGTTRVVLQANVDMTSTGNAINLNTFVDESGARTLTLVAGAGAITLADVEIDELLFTSGANVTFEALDSAHTGNTDGSDITTTANIDFSGIAAGDNLILNADTIITTGGDVITTAGNIVETGGARELQVAAGDSITLQNVTITGNLDIDLDTDTGGANLDIDTVTAASVDVDGTDVDDTMTFNSTVTSTVAGVAIANADTVTLEGNVTAATGIDVDNIGGNVDIDTTAAGGNIDITASNGDLEIRDGGGVNQIRIVGANTVTFDANGNVAPADDRDVFLANIIDDGNDPTVIINSEGAATLGSIDVGNGDVTIAVDNGGVNDAITLTAPVINASTITVTGGGNSNDIFDITGPMTTNATGAADDNISISFFHNVDIGANVTAADNLTISDITNFIDVDSGVTLEAQNGNVDLNNTVALLQPSGGGLVTIQTTGADGDVELPATTSLAGTNLTVNSQGTVLMT